MYYPCSENKDADQLRGYREADLRLCFRPCKLLVFSRTGSISSVQPSLATAQPGLGQTWTETLTTVFLAL